MNILQDVPMYSDPMVLLDELGRKKDLKLEPIRLTDLTQVTGLPRETVRRKLERLRKLGKVDRTSDGKWYYLNPGELEREFTRNTVRQFLMTAQILVSILDKVDPRQVVSTSP
jgi:DNA-binding IclR family transcriptional regulator